ncbi:MAG: hypothetical protein NC098_02945 [Lachnoclostridium sp.]|nr:hypothetical protein [Lachnoclostridium sp.]
MEPLKHECGIAMIRLLKPLEYYKKKYGSWSYGLSKLYLMMEKQHNRGQEGAGIGVVKMHSVPGHEYVFRERAQGSGAISEIFDHVWSTLADFNIAGAAPEDVERYAPFIGQIYMGHLRYSTTGKSGLSYVHPFLRRNNWKSRNLLMCGNFNMTNVDRIFDKVVARGQHPRLYSDTVVLLEQLGDALDKENHRIYREYRDSLVDPELSHAVEDNLDMRRVLASAAPDWDGGFVICTATGSGDMAVLRDRHGIRPAFYYADDEIVAVASERPVLQTVFDLELSQVQELKPGSALIVSKSGRMQVTDILGCSDNARCSFERIYFSRGSDADIYRERKQLGANVVPAVISELGGDISDAIFSFIPNTAEVAFLGMAEALNAHLDCIKTRLISEAISSGDLSPERLESIMARRVRIEKLALKDIKLRTFIAEGDARNDLAAHVYDITYGTVRPGIDSLVVIDDSIVRGTTLSRSILKILDRLHPEKIVIVSSSPQVRYPDYYGIDMSRMGEFIAFRAAVELLHERGLSSILDDTYRRCLEMEDKLDFELVNCVKAVYAPFSDEDISRKIAEMLSRDGNIHARVSIIYQTISGLHEAVPTCPGDWYFSGNYPTPGGTRLVNRAFVNFYEGNLDKR